MISGALEGLVALIIAALGAFFIFGQIKENSKKNEEDINDIKTLMNDFQDKMIALLTQSMNEVKAIIDKEKNNSRESLSREINHLKDLINMSNVETREDIKRLEAEQKESNNLKMKVAVISQSVKSLHHRLDEEIPTILEDS